jgi:FixJ family two-component response regulator
MDPRPTIFVVDDNEATRQALKRLLESAGLPAETSPSPDFSPGG